MKLFLKSIDYFSPKFTYTYKGKDKYNTVLGGVATILSLLIIIVNAWIIGKDIYYRENPIVVGYDQAFSFYPTTKINYNNMFFGFFISDVYNYAFEDESIVKIIPLIYANYYDKDGKLKYKERFLELIDCSSEYERLNQTAPLTPFIIKPIKCIKNLNEILSGFWTDTFLSYFMFKVHRCTNETISEISNLETVEDELEFKQFEKNMSKINLISLNNEDKENDEFIRKLNNIKKNDKNSTKKENKTITCKPIEEIQKVTQNLYFNFFYTSVVIDAKNYTAPMITQISEDWFTLGMGIFKTIDYYIQNFIVRTDDGMIFSKNYKDINKLGYYKHLADQQLLDNSNSNIFCLSIYVSNQVKYMTREYIKLQSIFANLGGIIQVVLIFFKVLFYPYFQKKLNLKIINELFDFDDALISGINDKKVLRRSNVIRIDSLIGTKIDRFKEKDISKIYIDINKLNNTNNNSNLINPKNRKTTTNHLCSNHNFLDRSKADQIKVNREIINKPTSKINNGLYESKKDLKSFFENKDDSNVKKEFTVKHSKQEIPKINLVSYKHKTSKSQSKDLAISQSIKEINNNLNKNLQIEVDSFKFEESPIISNSLLKMDSSLNKCLNLDFNNFSKIKNLESRNSDLLEINEKLTGFNSQNKKKSHNEFKFPLKIKECFKKENKDAFIDDNFENNKQNKCNLQLKENVEAINCVTKKSFQESKLSMKENFNKSGFSNSENNQAISFKKTRNKHKNKKRKKSNKHLNTDKQFEQYEICLNEFGKLEASKNEFIDTNINIISEIHNEKFDKNIIYRNPNQRILPHDQIENSKDKKIKFEDNAFLNIKDNYHLTNVQNYENNIKSKFYNPFKKGQDKKAVRPLNGKYNNFHKSGIVEDNILLRNNVINDISDSKIHLFANNVNSNLTINKIENLKSFNDDRNLLKGNDFMNNIKYENINKNLFYIKPENYPNNYRRKKRYRLRQAFESSEFENKINEALNIKARKLNLKNIEIFNSFYCYICCRSRNFKKKNMLYKNAYENLNQFTDYLEGIKNFQDLTKIKYLLFNTEQILSFPYLSNPKKIKVGFQHEIQEYARAFESRVCNKEIAIEIYNYFQKNIQNETLNPIDKKIWNIFDSKMKNLFILTSNESNKN